MPTPPRPQHGWGTSETDTDADRRQDASAAGSSKRHAPASSTKPDLKDASRGVRLQKFLAQAGVASRREAETMILEGRVTVNSSTVTELPLWVNPNVDRIAVDNKPVRRPAAFVYVALYKPRRVVTTNKDPQGRPRAIDLVDHPSKARLFPVGRLDYQSTGLLLLTNDGELAQRLTHPRHGVHKTYEVVVDGLLTTDDVRKLEAGIFLTDQRKHRKKSDAPVRAAKTARSRLELKKRDRDRTILRMELREGRNRQIRRMMARLGYTVNKLRRIQMGPLKLHGLKPGQWRDLTLDEVRQLKRAAKLPT